MNALRSENYVVAVNHFLSRDPQTLTEFTSLLDKTR